MFCIGEEVKSMNQLLMKAMTEKRTIVIFYQDQYNNVTERFIRVLRVNDEVVTAYCFWRKQVRNFKIANILSAGKQRKKRGA